MSSSSKWISVLPWCINIILIESGYRTLKIRERIETLAVWRKWVSILKSRHSLNQSLLIYSLQWHIWLLFQNKNGLLCYDYDCPFNDFSFLRKSALYVYSYEHNITTCVLKLKTHCVLCSLPHNTVISAEVNVKRPVMYTVLTKKSLVFASVLKWYCFMTWYKSYFLGPCIFIFNNSTSSSKCLLAVFSYRSVSLLYVQSSENISSEVLTLADNLFSSLKYWHETVSAFNKA